MPSPRWGGLGAPQKPLWGLAMEVRNVTTPQNNYYGTSFVFLTCLAPSLLLAKCPFGRNLYRNMENKTWIGTGLLFVVAVAAAYFIGQSSNNSTQPTNTPQAKTSSLDAQQKCATQASESFDKITGGNNGGVDNLTYQNHYNSSLDKCYILIHGFGAGGVTDELWNAYENKALASCDSFTAAPDISSCSYKEGSTEKYDLDKFKNFVKPYMEN